VKKEKKIPLNSKDYYYCNKCYKRICGKHKNDHKEHEEDFFLIKAEDLNKKCYIHNKEFKKICISKFEKICKECENKPCKHFNCETHQHITKLNEIDVKLYENRIENIINKWKELKNLYEDFQKLLKNFLNFNDLIIKFMKNLILNYKNSEKSNTIMYESIINLNVIDFKDLNILVNNLKKFNEYISNNFYILNENSLLNNKIKFYSNINFNINNFTNINILNNYTNTNTNTNIIMNSFNFSEKPSKAKIYKSIDSHEKSIVSLLFLKNFNRLLSASDDGSMIIYDENFKEQLKIKAHEYPIDDVFQLKDGKIMSSSYDKTIKIFDLKKTKENKLSCTLIQTLEGHTREVNQTIELDDGRLVSGSWDKSLIFWKKKKNDWYEKEFQKEDLFLYTVGCVFQTKQNEIVISSFKDGKIKFLETKKCDTVKEMDVSCIGFPQSFCKINENCIAMCEKDKRVIFIDIINYQIINQINGNNTFYSIIKENNKLIIGDLEELSFYLLDNNENQCQIQTLELIEKINVKKMQKIEKIVTIAYINENLIAIGTKDKNVKVIQI
jgi:WD40 repeat protein